MQLSAWPHPTHPRVTSPTRQADNRDTHGHVSSESALRPWTRLNRTRTRPHTATAERRHSNATSLVNAGMSLQALMALLRHESTEMTVRYASLAAPTLRAAYEEAMSKARTRLTLSIAPVGKPIVPDRVAWLRGEMLKTRVAHGYCSRQLAAEACPYANVCEQCDNYVTATEFIPARETQLADVTALRDDATERGWNTEVARHARVIASIQSRLERLTRHADASTNS
jgi:hypothetical protein